MQVSFLPDRLQAPAALTVTLRLGAGEALVPPPLSKIVVRLPAGLGIDLRGVRTCTAANLRRRGLSGCSAGSLIGRGHAVLEVHAGSQSIPEQALVWAFRAPDSHGRPAIAILSRGETPLQQQTVSTGVLAGDSAPYGSRLTISIPPIPTLVLEPDASVISLSLTIGGMQSQPKAHTAAGAIIVPPTCPAGGFPFAAVLTFADGVDARATARARCPRR
ncbi:MAG: hypothetical protein QOI03_1621 [Solirubrobacteraceae bacterium]|jgi:hypothetical protein|nr:hypothetical protein [Solirubrobacteraceae bacterium]